jgi:hypothetical protein
MQKTQYRNGAYRWKVVLFLMAFFLFAYDCHLVNCAHYTRSTARQRYVSDTTQEDQGRLTPRRAALAAALACLPVLVAAADSLAMSADWEELIEAHFAKFLCDRLLPRFGATSRCMRSSLDLAIAM